MKKGNLYSGFLLVLLCLTATKSFSQNQASPLNNNIITSGNVQQRTPVESFIQRIKETNTFVPVTAIWQADDLFDKTAMLQKVTKAQPLTIDYTQVAALIQQNYTAISLVIPGIDGRTYTIDLAQYSYLTNDFQAHTMSGNVETPYDYTPGKYYSGVVSGIPGSVAAFSFFKNQIFGIFSIPGVGNFVLVPNTMNNGKYYNYNQHYILYNDNDLKILDQAPQCGADKLNTDYLYPGHNAYRTTTTPNNNVYNNCKEIRVMEVGDYATYLTNGSNTGNVINYLTALFNNQATIYRNEGVLIDLKFIQVNATSDAYQTITTASSNPFLAMFGQVTQNTYSTTHGCDLAILVATDLNAGYGKLGGLAWLQALCQNFRTRDSGGSYGFCDLDNGTSATGFPVYSWDVEVLSHEMGHIVGSPHTHACCWNPPGSGTTAIDGCVAVEGSCARPGTPPAGGTIMSYCHLVTGVGINFTNGFGQQPGDTVRYYIAHRPTTCGAQYNPSTALSTANRTVSANRECTDLTSGITYYWNDDNTADQADDTLVLMVKKGTNNIGDLNTPGFSVTANTIVNYGSGVGDTISFPPGTSASILSHSYGMRRYWKMTPTATPATAVEVMFPFLSTDTADVHGCVLPSAAALSDYLMYTAYNPINPNPANGFPGAAPSDFSIYTFGTTASASVWSLSTVGTGGVTKLAHMLTTNLNGGGTGFFSYCTPHTAPTLAAVPTPPCPAATAVYSVTPDLSALSYVWTVTGAGWSGSSTTDNITLTAGSGPATITVKAVDSCGPGNAYTFTITPTPFPVETISAITALCTTATTVQFSATATTGNPTSYSWTVLPAGGWSGTSSSSVLTATGPASPGVITVVVNGTNICGAGPDDTFHAAMTLLPPVAPTSITPPPLACPSSSGLFTTPAISGATTYTWTVAGTGWTGFSSTNSITVNIGTGPGTLTVNASNGCGTSPDYSQTINTSTGPSASTSITAPVAPCKGTSVTLTTPLISSASSYHWVVSGTGWSGSSATNSLNVTVGSGPGIITVNPVNACGNGGSFTTTITAAPAPGSTFAVSSHIAKVSADIVAYYTGSAPAGSTFAWNFSGGTASPGTGSGAQTVHWNTPGQYIIYLTVSNGSGCSSATADTINVIAVTDLQNLAAQRIDVGIVPNPNNGSFDILFTDPVNQPISVRLFDMQGRMVYNNNFTDAASGKISVETNNLSPGTYTATIYVNESAVSKKITIFR